jgi:oligopeptidase A
MKVVPADGEVEVWHPDVRFFKILDPVSGAPRAYFYLDPYTRPVEKRGGAWMDDVVGRDLHSSTLQLNLSRF